MKAKYPYIILILLPFFAACSDWLREDGPMTNRVEDFFTSGQTAVQVTNAVYTPLMWEFQGTYYSEFYFGDILSDDALKGGQNISDMSNAYDLENFKAISNNTMVLDFFRAQYMGIARANLAIEQVPAMAVDSTLTEGLRTRLEAEARYMRAYYYFRLVRLYGGVPISTSPIYSSAGWKVPRSSVDEVYAQIVSDLEFAEGRLPLKSAYPAEDLGRATKGAAQAMLMKAYLYWGDHKRNNGEASADLYATAKSWGGKFMTEQAGEYGLHPDYRDNFTLEGENGMESVFEIQYMEDGMSDYGEGNGFTRGTFALVQMRSRSTKFGVKGWGFNKPTQNLYDEFEAGDPRRDASIFIPIDEQMSSPAEEIYLGNRYLSAKRTMLDNSYLDRHISGDYDLTDEEAYKKFCESLYITLDDDHDSRSPINSILIRLADVYLMYAEVCLRNGDVSTARTYLEMVRSRARGNDDILPEFPGYKVPDYRNAYALHQLADTPEDLELAIRHERRVELAMECHRWYDLCRWGIVKEVMDAYKASETLEARQHMAEFVKGKHELLPIPDEEVRLGGLAQNPGY